MADGRPEHYKLSPFANREKGAVLNPFPETKYLDIVHQCRCKKACNFPSVLLCVNVQCGLYPDSIDLGTS